MRARSSRGPPQRPRELAAQDVARKRDPLLREDARDHVQRSAKWGRRRVLEAMSTTLRRHRSEHRENAGEGQPAGDDGGEREQDRSAHEYGHRQHMEDEISAVVVDLPVRSPLRREEPGCFCVVHAQIVRPRAPSLMYELAGNRRALNELATNLGLYNALPPPASGIREYGKSKG